MVLCIKCNSDIHEDDPRYIYSDMGPEIISVIENDIGYEVHENAQICGHCFANIMQIMSASTQSGRDTQSDHEEFELQQSHDQHVCIWCQGSLHQRRTHSLPEGRERHLISEQISPRIIADNSLLCYVCWVRITRIVREEQGEVEAAGERSSSCIAGKRTVGCCAHTMTIVWYLGWARHQASIAAPVPFLDDILIGEDLDYHE